MYWCPHIFNFLIYFPCKEPDLKMQSIRVAVNREKAEKRHREALMELKQQREKDHEAQTRFAIVCMN